MNMFTQNIVKPSSYKKKMGSGKRNKRDKRPNSDNWQFPAKLLNEKLVLHSILPKYSVEFYGVIVNDIIRLITQLIRDHGFNDGSKRYSVIKNYTVQLIEHRKPENPGWVSTSRSYKVPSKLGENFIQLIVDYLRCTEEDILPKYYQAINTILNIVRIVEGKVSPDFKSVTDPANAIDDELIKSFETYVEKELSKYKYSKQPVNLWNYRLRLLKNGPNKVPKVESAILEANLLLNSKLFVPFKRICDEMECNYLVEYLKSLEDIPIATDIKLDETARKHYLRKLVKVPDSGFKTRIVAISDFWTQLIMLPVRDHIQYVTKTKFGKTDFRMNQDNGVAAMTDFQIRCLRNEKFGQHELSPDGLKFYDISNWTDRFHRDLQKIVMKNLFSPRLAEAWGQLVVHCDWYSPDLDQTIKYGQGQGMGTNGSFDIATLTDHLYINFIYDEKSQERKNFPSNEFYGKVGDDLWIYDPENLITDYYKKISLPINLSKSKTFLRNSISEFCSRTFRDGVDVSRISPNIINRSSDFRYMPLLLGICSSRKVQLHSSTFSYLNRKVKDTEETYLNKLQDWILSFLVIGKFEPSSFFKSLTLEYLVEGGWITENSRLSKFLEDQQLSTRLLICHSIVKITDAKKSIQDKIFENVFAMDDWGDEVTSLCEEGSNLFDPSNIAFKTMLDKVPEQSTLLPKQIIVLGRYVDQRRLVQEPLWKADSDSKNIEKPEQMLEYAKTLMNITNKSCYDDGNITYDKKRLQSSQFQVVNLLQKSNEDLTTFTLDFSQNDYRSVLRDLQYDRLSAEWEGLLPTIM